MLIMGVQMRFLNFNKESNEIEVVTMDFDHGSVARSIDNLIMSTTERPSIENVAIDECGVDIMGRTHHDSSCYNERYDELRDEMYCIIERSREETRRKMDEEWLPPMLGFYWQNGIENRGLDFLRNTGFIVSYE